MSDPNRSRITLYLGVLVALAAVFIAVLLIVDVSVAVLGIAYMFSPLIAGLVVCYSWRVPLSEVGVQVGRLRWLALSAFVVVPLSVLLIAFWIGFPGVSYDLTASPITDINVPAGLSGIPVIMAFVVISIVFAFGEEFGWRGYLLWELAPLGFWKASCLVGAAWGVWHTPVIIMGHNFPSFPFVGAVLMILACITFSPLYTYLVVRAESVFAATILHGVFNATPVLAIGYAVTDDPVLGELVASSVGVAGIVVFGLTAAAIYVGGTPQLTRGFADGQQPNTKRERVV